MDTGTRTESPDAESSSVPEPKWRSRGYLPHYDAPGALQVLTFRLADALPAEIVHAIMADSRCRTDSERWERMQTYLDAGHGSCYLRDERVAALMQRALLRFDGDRYHLLVWSIMPNHVHVLIETVPGYPLDRVLHSWKSFTATMANRILGRQGTFWQVEYFDRYVRNADHLEAAAAYIDGNRSQFSSAEWAGKRGRPG